MDSNVAPVLKEILNELSYSVDFNDKYLHIRETLSNKMLTLFNPISNKVEIIYPFDHKQSVKRIHTNSNDLIAIQYDEIIEESNKNMNQHRSIILLNKKLEIIKKKDLSEDLIGLDEENLYFTDWTRLK